MADDPATQKAPAPAPAPSATANLDDRHIQLEAKVEDAETRAAREELKQTAISDNKGLSAPTAGDGASDDSDMKLRSGKKTPELAPAEARPGGDAAADKRAASPKKKRAHDEVDQKEEGEGPGKRISSGTSSEGGWVMVDGGDKEEESRSEPQKKRARDETSPPADIHKTTAAMTSSNSTPSDPSSKGEQQAQTSSSAFAASGFSKLASSTASPFASIGANKSVFGSGAAASPSPFASLGSPSPTKPAAPANLPKPTLSFASKDASAPSPFGTINGSVSSGFGGGGGSVFGGGSAFGSALGGSKISSFASPGAPLVTKSDKPAKPFGAPESDAEDDDEDGSGDDDGDEAGGNGGDAEKEDTASRDASATPAAGGEEEKKTKFKKVFVDDGEAGEATIVQVRARMYYLDKSTNAAGKEEIGWRERGAGILKVNVPVECVSIDPETGAADAKSFDPSILNESTPEGPKLIRLLMRQDSTLRVILNSAILTAKMEFQLKEGLKAKSVLFTAIEGEDAKHVQVQMKMSPQSADTFMKAIDGILEKLKTKDKS